MMSNCSNQGIEIHYIWTPSHRGIEGNEGADKLAKEGSNQRLPYNKTDLTCKEGKQLAKQVCREKFIAVFLSTDVAQHYKSSITNTHVHTHTHTANLFERDRFCRQKISFLIQVIPSVLLIP